MSQHHAFDARPHRTLLVLSIPVLLSLIAEPLTALVDTAFIAQLGSSSLTALGVGTTLLSAVFWIFNFLSVGAQSEIARLSAAGEQEGARQQLGLALFWSASFGAGLLLIGFIFAGSLVELMAAQGETFDEARDYFRIRLFAAPAVLMTAASFGALRGLELMRVPMQVAIIINLLNIGLDAWLIFGWGPIPAMGIRGAAWATLLSQWIGCALALRAVFARLGMPLKFSLAGSKRLMQLGGDMFVRTGLLTFFLILTTRAATQIGDEAGAAHHAIRQVWLFTALALDAMAVSAQSLVAGYFGRGNLVGARRVARVCCAWSFCFGVLLAAFMLIAEPWAAVAWVPPEARIVFASAWLWGALAQPLNAMCFATDGLHWGSQDFRYLRNGMLLASAAGVACLWLARQDGQLSLERVWWVMTLWVSIRAGWGLGRIWPAWGASPFRLPTPTPTPSS